MAVNLPASASAGDEGGAQRGRFFLCPSFFLITPLGALFSGAQKEPSPLCPFMLLFTFDFAAGSGESFIVKFELGSAEIDELCAREYSVIGIH